MTSYVHMKQDRFLTCFKTCRTGSPILRGGEWVQSPYVSRLTDRHQTYRTSGVSGAARNPCKDYFVIMITLVIY